MSETQVVDPFDTVSWLLSDSIENRREMADSLKKHIPAIIASYVEAALGVWKEEVQVTRKGAMKVNVYQTAPDVKACNALMRLANYDPEEVSKVLMSMSRVKSIEAEIAADLAKAKAKNLESQTYLNEKNADAFAASFVLEEDVQGAALGVFSAAMGYIQSIPVEVMAENCKSQATYQEWQMNVAKVAEEAYRRYVDTDKPALESGEDEDGEEEDDA